METIEKYELLQPILVIPKDDHYELISGHRRLEAMKARNEATIPCIVRTDFSEKNIPFIKLIENVQRKQLSTYELVKIFEEMKKNTPGLTQYHIAQMVGKSTAWVHSKYKAGKIIAELIEQGVPGEAIDELMDADLIKLTRRVKDKKERKKIASKLKDSNNKDSLIREAASYQAPGKIRTYSKSDMRRVGFRMLYSGDHNILVVCRSKLVRKEIEHILFKYYWKKTDEYRERLRLCRTARQKRREEFNRYLQEFREKR